MYNSDISPILKKISDVVLDKIPYGLPPIRDFQHHIDLVPKVVLLNKASYRMSLKKDEEL